MVFITLEEAFEQTVIFFELTNLLVIFQTTVNKIFWNLIDTGKVVIFIDNVIVGTEEEKRYDKIVEEVIKKLTENDLYMKPEKYK